MPIKLGANLSKEENVRTPYQELLFWPCTYLKIKRWPGLWKFHYAKFWLGTYFRWSSKRECVFLSITKTHFGILSKFDLTSLRKTLYEFMRILTANQINFQFDETGNRKLPVNYLCIEGSFNFDQFLFHFRVVFYYILPHVNVWIVIKFSTVISCTPWPRYDHAIVGGIEHKTDGWSGNLGEGGRVGGASSNVGGIICPKLCNQVCSLSLFR